MDLLNSKLARFDISDSGRPYYLLFNSDIISGYKIDDFTSNYIICEDGYYLYSRSFPTILKRCTELTAEDWYKKYVLELPLSTEIRCKECNRLLHFISISKGYSNGIGAGYRNHWFCSNSCSTKYFLRDKEVRNKLSESLNSVVSQAKGRCTHFINQGDPFDNCDIYLGIPDDNELIRKFGITSNLNLRSHYFNSNLHNIKSIRSGTRILVACLERDLKIYLNQNNEYISLDKEQDVINYIINYKIDENEYYSRGILPLE